MVPALRGMALLRWLETARFCGACGSPLEDKEGGGDDAGGRACTACGRLHFPRISPAVIVLIRKGKRALLAHNARFRSGFFGLIAGFVEAGETLEEAAAREAREEAGVEIRDLRYVKSQPWPFPDSLMVAFNAEWASGEARPDGVEIGELRWCLPSELPEIPPKGSVARYLLDEFAREG
jgi:NAD+ diphosphatase